MASKRPLPPMTHGDVEDIVTDLEKALDNQRDWFKNFQAMLVCRSEPDSQDLQKNGYRRGPFARWFKKGANPHLRDRADFAAALDALREQHEMAQGLAKTVCNGADINSKQYHMLVESSDRFTQSVRTLHAEARMLLSNTDPLTGVATRFAMIPRLEQERERSMRSEDPCSVCMMDLDRFKSVNDTYGHRAGDMVLQETTRFVLKHLRHYDQVYRYGGEEFVLMLPDTPPGRAKHVLDRLRRSLKRHGTRLDDETVLHVGASFGIAVLQPDVSVRAAIDRADQALYAAKSAGRNRVHIWEEDVAPGKGRDQIVARTKTAARG
ncbi:MAG TPA: diguanylate cyclase [Rhodospirillales bacterium]|nr:diguanylate cyclase [Rhodospirillales bacterium]